MIAELSYSQLFLTQIELRTRRANRQLTKGVAIKFGCRSHYQ